ncbi:hypothetical protein Pfo_018235 [Paulownia fortunei]|nr:hypothetical protein Pfo_018235 [Paulownia fortunei]
MFFDMVLELQDEMDKQDSPAASLGDTHASLLVSSNTTPPTSANVGGSPYFSTNNRSTRNFSLTDPRLYKPTMLLAKVLTDIAVGAFYAKMQEVNDKLKKELAIANATNKTLTKEVDTLKGEAEMASAV